MNEKERLLSIIDKFPKQKIMIIGDIMLDKYIWGNVERISPEAPVPVVHVVKETYAPGGASNVASNISSLKGIPFMVGIVGNDLAKETLLDEFQKRNVKIEGIVTDHAKPTTQKVRIIGHKQQLLRFDYENNDIIDTNTEKKIMDFIEENIPDSNAVVISDYAKGVISEGLFEFIKKMMKKKKIPFIVDPKPSSGRVYKDATIITPNQKEAYMLANSNDDIEKVGMLLVKKTNSNVLVTRGEKGMSLFALDGTITNIPTKAKEVYDVTGAGDTVVAALALALSAGANLKEASMISNYAAGIVVGKVGTSTATIGEIKKIIMEDE